MNPGASLIAFAVMSSMALAQEQGQQPPTTDHGAHHGQTGQPTGQPSMGGGPMMGGVMGQQMMGSGQQSGQPTGQPPMGGGSMMGGMMGQAGICPGMMRGGMGAIFGARVTPMMNLSVEDVRGYLGAQLERLNNKRLKLGDIKADDGAITADIVTVDNSLVQRLKIDRHTGTINYQD
jgi:hypothetical protein